MNASVSSSASRSLVHAMVGDHGSEDSKNGVCSTTSIAASSKYGIRLVFMVLVAPCALLVLPLPAPIW